MRPGSLDTRRGILLKIASVLGFTVMGACVKAGSAVVPINEVCFFRAFFAMLTVLGYLAWRGELPAAIHTPNPWGHFWRGMLGLMAMTLTFSALAYLPLSDAIALSYAMPLFLTILAALMLGERVRAFRWTGVLIGLVGVVVILWPRLTFLKGGGTTGESIGAMCALAGAFVVALGSIVVTRLVMAERATTVVFYFSAYSSVGFLLTLPFAWTTPDAAIFLVLVASGVIGGICQLLMTASYRYADASTLAPFEYTSILFGIVLGMALFGDAPTAAMLLGSAIVVAAGLIVLWREHALALRRADVAAVWPWAIIGVEKHDGA